MPNYSRDLGAVAVVNTTLYNQQTFPKVSALAGGGYVIVWQSAGQDGQNFGVYAQRFDATGHAVGAETLVNTTTADSQIEPTVSGLAGGGYVVSWYTIVAETGAGLGIYSQQFDASGARVGGEVAVNTTISAHPGDEKVAGLSDGGYVIMWQSQRSSGWNDILAQRFNAGGAKVGGEIKVSSGLDGSAPHVTALPNGGFIAVYTSNTNSDVVYDPSKLNLVWQLFDASGAKVGGESILANIAGGGESDAQAVVLANGEYLLTWEQVTGVTGLYGQLVKPDGSRDGSAVLLQPGGAQLLHVTTALPEGGFAIAWEDIHAGIYERQFDAHGVAFGSAQSLYMGLQTPGLPPGLAALNNGDVVVTFGQYLGGDTYFDVYQRLFTEHVTSGTAGADVLVGTAQDEIFTGNAGADTVTGGGGSDVFRDTVANLSGDTVTDLQSGDVINLTNASISNFTFNRVGATLLIGAGQSMTLSNNPAGHMIMSADPGGGVDLTLGAHVTGLNDFNGDGHSDFLFSNTSNGVFATWNISGNTTASHVDRTVLSGQVDAAYQIQGTFDFNGDGVSDLVWRNSSTGFFTVWLGVGSSFITNVFASPASSSYAMAGFGDFNGDGKDDILFRSTSTGVFTEWQSSGGAFAPNVYVNGSVDTSYHIQAIGDFDGDGKSDLLWRNASGFLTVWSSTGTGFTPNTAMIGGVDTTWHVAATADFNGDGKEDILFRNDSGVFTEWQSTGAGFTQNVYVNGGVDNSWRLQGAFDFNDDGKADLLWRNDNGTLTIWQSTGNGFLPNVLVDGSVANAYAIVTHHYDVV